MHPDIIQLLTVHRGQFVITHASGNSSLYAQHFQCDHGIWCTSTRRVDQLSGFKIFDQATMTFSVDQVHCPLVQRKALKILFFNVCKNVY